MLMVAIRFNMRVHFVKIKITSLWSIFVEFVLSKAINLGQNVLRLPKIRLPSHQHISTIFRPNTKVGQI
jgi:hypothetical protein